MPTLLFRFHTGVLSLSLSTKLNVRYWDIITGHLIWEKLFESHKNMPKRRAYRIVADEKEKSFYVMLTNHRIISGHSLSGTIHWDWTIGRFVEVHIWSSKKNNVTH